MEQKIINAISLALDSVFPRVPKTATETEQDLGRPAFFIACIGSQIIEKIQHAGFFVIYSFDILYDPGVTYPEPRCRSIQSVLTLLLRRIPDPESQYAYRPFDIHFVTEDGVLHALFKIQETLLVEGELEPLIEEFELNSSVEIINK